MIETQEYKNFQGFTGDDHKVGVSKPLSELTPDDIINYDKYLCGEINKYVNVTYFGKIPQISLPEDGDNKPMFSTNVSWNDTFWCSQPPKKDLYMRTLLLNVPNNKRDREYTFTVLDTNVRIVTELTDFQDMYITTKIGKPDGAPHSSKTEAGTVETGKISGIVKNMLTDTSYITPVWVITDGTNLWITSGVIYHSYYVNFNNNLTNQGFNSGIPDFNNNKDNSLSFGINPNLTSEPVKCTDILPESEKPYTVNVNEKTFGIMISYGGSNYQPRGKFWFNNNIDENTTPFGEGNQFIDITAYYGMYMRSAIKNNNEYVWYKPIITGGMVTGYTTDMNAKSDIDNWEILENHNIPIIPPSPGGDDDDDSDDINFGGSYAGLGAFAKFYLCSGVEISQLNSWINGRSPDWPENFDPMTQIISISRFATDLSSASYGSTTIKFHTTAGAEIDTKIPALHGNGDNIELDLGSVNIPLRMKERGIPFLDYESTIELYIPACGTFILDPQTVLGSTLSVKMWLSTSTGECNSIAYVTRNGVKAPVAYGSGSLAVPMPVTSIGWGSYLAQVTNANIKYYFGGLGIAASGSQIMTGNDYGLSSGLFGISGGFQNMAQAEQNLAHLKNSSFTSVSGSFGSTAAWNYPFNAYVKITRRHFKKPSNYAHTRGIPLVETKTLSDCSGFTICVNADVSSINATIQEKNMIVEALNNGVIV